MPNRVFFFLVFSLNRDACSYDYACFYGAFNCQYIWLCLVCSPLYVSLSTAGLVNTVQYSHLISSSSHWAQILMKHANDRRCHSSNSGRLLRTSDIHICKCQSVHTQAHTCTHSPIITPVCLMQGTRDASCEQANGALVKNIKNIYFFTAPNDVSQSLHRGCWVRVCGFYTFITPTFMILWVLTCFYRVI